MEETMFRITSSRRKALIATASTLFICAAAALAYILATYNFSGEGSSTFGKAPTTPIAEKLTITPPAGLTPVSGYAPLPISIESATTITLEPGAKITLVPKSTPAVCASYLEYREVASSLGEEVISSSGTTSAIALTAKTPKAIEGIEVEEKNVTATNQTECEAATYSIHGELIGKGH
jgi:hypothetical protein